jgi:hypothetical protein
MLMARNPGAIEAISGLIEGKNSDIEVSFID